MVSPLRVGEFGHKQGSYIGAEERNFQKKNAMRGEALKIL